MGDGQTIGSLMRKSHVLALGWMACAAVGVTACSNPQPDQEICSPVMSQAAVSKVFEAALARPKLPSAALQAAVVNRADQCVRRWGYRLAKSKEPVETVTKATLAACNLEISAISDPRFGADQSCLNCRSTSELALVINERARLSVVQGRIGDCTVGYAA